jgi:hypothetical protein
VNYNCSISNCHNLIGFTLTLNLTVPTYKARWISYRSFRKFNDDDFFNEFRSSDLSFINAEENVDQVSEKNSSLLTKTFDEFMPQFNKEKSVYSLPFTWTLLWGNVSLKRMVFIKYLRNRNIVNRENYRQSRNLVSKIKKQLNNFFGKDALEGVNSLTFWRLSNFL